MLSAIFISSGVQSLLHPERLEPRAKLVTDRVTPVLERIHARIPTDTRTLIRLNAAVEVSGGVLLATGRASRPAAAVLAGTLAGATLAGHPYWMEEDPAQRANQRIHFLKNLGLFGGLLLAAADTEGRPSLRWRLRHAARNAKRARRILPG